MAEARVEFLTLQGEPCPAEERPARFTFRCARPAASGRNGQRCGRLLLAAGPHTQPHGVPRDGQNLNGGRAQWDWDGTRHAPTFTPSVNCASACGWHGYIRSGRTVDCSGADEPEPSIDTTPNATEQR